MAPHTNRTPFKRMARRPAPKEVKLTKQALDWPLDPSFYIPDSALAHFRLALENGKQAEAEWDVKFSEYSKAFPDLAQEIKRRMDGQLPDGWDNNIPVFPAD